MILETERLLLQKFEMSDAAFIIELLNTPGWLRFIGDRGVKTIEDAERYIQNVPVKSYKENGFGLYKVVLKESNAPIGMCGLIKRDTLDHVDIGFAFLPAYTGKGYAYEAAKNTLMYANETLKLEKLLAIVLPDNTASVSLLKKIGMGYREHIQMGEEELMLFST